MDKKAKKKNPNTPKPPKKITERYLYNSGLYYLQRFPASKDYFKFIMMRKIKKSCAHHTDQSLEECQKILDQTADKFVELGHINDKQYAFGLVNSYRKRGVSKKAIIAKMKHKRLPIDMIQNALEEIDKNLQSEDINAELMAAIKHAKKKRLGPFSKSTLDKNETPDEKEKRRTMGSFARAGFSYDTVKRVLTLEDPQNY